MNYFELKKMREFYATSIQDQNMCEMEVKWDSYRYCLDIHHRFENESYFTLFVSKNDLLNSHAAGFLLNFKDPLHQFATICNKYFSLDPVYIGLNSGGKCHQVKESFDEWVSSRSRRFLFGNLCDLRFTELSYHIHPSNIKSSERKAKEMLRYFMKPSLKAICDPTLSTRLSLPLFGGSIELNSISREWLLLLTWYRKIANELEPALTAAKAAENKKKKRRDLMEKLNSSFLECQNLKEILFKFDVHEEELGIKSNLREVFTFRLQKLVDFNISDFQTLIITDPKVILLKAILHTSVKAANEAVNYIFDLQANLKVFKNNPDYSQTLTTIIVQQFHDALRHHFRKRFRIFNRFNEKYLIKLIVQKVGNLLKIYFRDYPVCNDNIELSQYRHNLEKMQHLVLDLIGEISFILIDTADEFYKVNTEGLEKMLRQISIILTGVAVLEQLYQSKFVRKAQLQAELDQKSELIQEKITSIPIFSGITGDLQNSVCEMMHHCICLVDQRKEERSMILIPASFIYGDFSFYLSCYSNMFVVCPHPLLNLYELTSGKIYKFMKESLIPFEKQKRNFDLVLQSAEHYANEDIN